MNIIISSSTDYSEIKKRRAVALCHFRNKNNERECPQCGFTTIQGMPGGRDSTCTQCGYKDPCCSDY